MSDLQERLSQAIGDRYAVERELGRGGMAIVFVATDLRHGRRVALKVLAPDVARSLGAERFLREIEIAARLNHPRIVPLLDSGTADDLLYYVMPYVEGESLRDRLDRETQLPVEEAVGIARQVAAALAWAHAQSVVHRDIKPGNILLTAGEALVADFGIAQAVTAAGGSRLTESGVAVGTPAYMSPEQASGAQELDARSDIYALGCVLYEMLAGEPPFTGPNARVVTLRKLSESAPDVTIVRDTVPSGVAVALRKALAPLPADRYSTAARFAEALETGLERAVPPAGAVVGRPPLDRIRRPLLVLAFLLLAALAIWPRLRPASTASGEPVRMVVTFPHGIVREVAVSALALSPDGRTLVATARSEAGQQLYRRELGRLEATPIEGTAGGQDPFFSPDGSWLGFYADGRLRRVPVAGGVPIDVIRLSRVPVGVAWGPDDRIVFARDWQSPLYVVDSHGGEATPLTALDTMAGEVAHVQPEILPDGRTLLFVTPGARLDEPRIHALDLANGRRISLIDGWEPRYAESGHLILRRGNTLLAAPFDAERLQLGGTIEALEDNIRGFAISNNGTLAYLPRPAEHELLVVGPDGSERFVTDERLTYGNPRFSPDGRSLAVMVDRGTGEDIWIYDVASGAASRLTREGGRAPIWNPDGNLTWVSLGRGIFTGSADGRGQPTRLYPLDRFHWLVGWTPDGRTLGFGVVDVGVYALEDGEVKIVVPGDIWGGRLSPDGRWLAYYSFESGSFDVWVTRFPGGGARWQITTDGGRDPSWAPAGLVLYYRSADRLVAAQIDTTAGVRMLSRRVVLEPFNPPFYDDFDIHPDLRTLAIVRPVADPVQRDVVVVLDWFTELGR